MAMSRIQLYRKLHRLTGKNVSQYIREVRLEKAMELLRQDVASVAEIAYQVGFGSPAYFNRCFHVFYGLTPGEVIRNKGWADSRDRDHGQQAIEEQKVSGSIPPKSFSRGIQKWVWFAAIGILLVMVILSLFFIIWKRSSDDVKEKTIAVFPLCLDNQDPENAYFCNGMAEELFTHLNKISGLKVKAGMVIEGYIGRPIDLENMQRKTGLDYILTLSTRKSANDLRVTVQLIDLLTGDQIWAGTYDGDYTGKIFEFHSNTAREIAAHLDVVITPEMEKELVKIPAENMKAYDEVIRGRYELQKFRQTFDKGHLEKANIFFDNALKIVLDYIEALGGKCGVLTASEKYDSAHYYADRIIELDRFSNRGYGHKGEVYFSTGYMDLAIENYLKAVNLPPRDPTWIWWNAALGRAFYFNNDLVNAIKYVRKAHALGFEASFSYGLLGYCYENLGEYDIALSYFHNALELDREYCWNIFNYARNLYIQSRTDDALDFLDSICSELKCEKICLLSRILTYTFGNRFSEGVETYGRFKSVQDIPGPNDTIYLACLYLKTGKPDSADLILKSYRRSLEKKLVLSKYPWLLLQLSLVHGYTDNREAMIRYLNEAFEQGVMYIMIDEIRFSPAYEVLWEYPELGNIIDEHLEKRARLRAEVAAMEDLEFRTLNTE
jgi:TolB-like protein/AraC-like DNA-binding protein/tetratricopeptide (TPR) repeat protein